MSVHFPNPIPADLAALDEQVRRMSGTLRCDFANGRIGERHNMFEHRSRLWRDREIAAPARTSETGHG